MKKYIYGLLICGTFELAHASDITFTLKQKAGLGWSGMAYSHDKVQRCSIGFDSPSCILHDVTQACLKIIWETWPRKTQTYCYGLTNPKESGAVEITSPSKRPNPVQNIHELPIKAAT